MPKQEYISLPEIKNEDLVDVLSTEEVKESGEEAIVKLLVHNPSGDKIKRIGIKDLTTEILDQSTEKNLTTITLKLTNPLRYVSMYYIKEIETIGAFNISYKREYDDYEKVLNVNMYKSIKTINDWKSISEGNSWNYRLEADLDFKNIPNNAVVGNFFGVLDGNNHTIKNIEVTTACGVFCTVNGTIKNMNINNFTSTNKTANNIGFIAGINGGIIDNVHLKDINITLGNNSNGALAGYAASANIINSSVTNVKVINNENLANARIGGFVGTLTASIISNSYVQNIDFDINNIISSEGVGGIVGYLNGANIYDCYSSGVIKTNYANVGGIAGFLTNNAAINAVYANVDIYSNSNYLGGIAGNIIDNKIGNSLSIGNLYTSVDTNYIGRIIGNNNYLNTNNYAYNKQHINGEISNITSGESLISKESLSDKGTYQNIIKLGSSFSYNDINDKLPKLYYKDSTKLLPNQEDIIISDNEFEILESVINKTIEESFIMFKIENKKELEITSIEIDDMNIKEVRKKETENGMTVVEILVDPIRYYDSYRLSKINYKENGKNKTYIVNYRINIQFYKDIESFEDWQKIDKNYAENYRLIADIDFKNKKNINTNVIINRLEGIDDGYSLKNVVIDTKKSNTYFIKEIKSSLKNIKFEGFDLKSTGYGNGLAIIGYTNGTIENLKFTNNKILGNNFNRVASIANNNSSSTKNINLENTGK